MPPRLRLWLIVAAAVYASYLLVGNLLLATSLVANLVNREPERFHGRWGAAVTLWPGQLLVWNLNLGGHAHQHVWSAHADFAHGRFAILPLFHHEFRMDALHATGVGIERDDVAVDLPSKHWTPDAWTFRFGLVDSHSLRMLRVNGLRATGLGTIAFGFVKQIHGGPWQLFPSHVHFDDARVDLGRIELARAARLDLDASIPSHRHVDISGTQVLGIAAATLRIAGAAPGLWMRSDPRGEHAWSNAEGIGRFDLALTIAHGDLQPGGRVHWDAPFRVSGANGERQYDGRLIADLGIDAGSIALDARIPGVPGGTGSLQATLRVDGNALPLAGFAPAIARISGAVDFDWRFTSLRWLAQAFARAPWLRLDGTGEIVAALRLQHGRLVEGSKADIPVLALEADVLDDVIAGEGRAHGSLVASKNGPVPRLKIDLDRFRIAQRKPTRQTFVNGGALVMELTSDTAISEFSKSFHAQMHFADADVPDLTFYNRHLPARNLRFISGRGRLGSELAFDDDGHVLDDHTHLRSDNVRLAFAGAQFSADLGLDAHLFRPRFQHHHFVVDGSTLELRNVVLEDSDSPHPRPWWAKVALQRGTVEHLHPLRMQAHVGLDMQDIRLLITLLGRGHDVPGWVLKVIDEGEVHAEGDLRLEGQNLLLDHVVARNGRFELLARLHAADRQVSGDLYLHWGPFGLGVELRDGKRKLHLAHARDWFDSGADLLPLSPGAARVRADDDNDRE